MPREHQRYVWLALALEGGRRRIVRLAFDLGQPCFHLQPHEHQFLADAVMQIARQAGSLLFLRLHHALGQNLQLGIGDA